MHLTKRYPGMTRVFLTGCLVMLLQPCVPLLAVALQDHKRSAIVGWNTAGVGVVRTILPLKGGDAFSIASASMFRPSGEAVSVRSAPS